jgi:hypothetical protein
VAEPAEQLGLAVGDRCHVDVLVGAVGEHGIARAVVDGRDAE